MDAFGVILFILGLVGIVYVTAYAWLEYRAERAEETNRVLEHVATEEVYLHYVQPLLFNKLRTWEGKPTAPTGEDPLVFARRTFTDLRRTLLLSTREFTTYVDLCEDALRRRRVRVAPRKLRRRVEDVCAQYVLRSTHLVDLCVYLQQIHLLVD